MSVHPVRGQIPCAVGCSCSTATSEAVLTGINVGPSLVYLNSVRFDGVPLVLPGRLGELELAEQTILYIDAES